MQRGDGADDQPDGDREQQRGAGELERGGQALDDRFADPLVRPDRATEVALQRLPEPGDVLHGQRLVEPERVAHLVQDLRIAHLARVGEHRIARRQPQQHERR